jgi:hypothetical protein
VGTVDRFQGQEAAVVLISMATSSGDDLPRQIEFLYSRNRLNVAISRARCRLAVIVASPRLLDTSCSTIEQMQLVNTLCWIKNFADRVADADRPQVRVKLHTRGKASENNTMVKGVGYHRPLIFISHISQC